MSEIQLEPAFSFPSNFRFGEVSSLTAFRDRVSSVPGWRGRARRRLGRA